MKGLPKLDRVTYRFIPDPNSALAALKAGDIDVSAFGLGPESVDELKKDARFQVIVGDTTNDVTLSHEQHARSPTPTSACAWPSPTRSTRTRCSRGRCSATGKILGSNVDPLNPYFVDVSKRVPYDPGQGQEAPRRGRLSRTASTRCFKVAPQYYYTVRTAEVIASQLAKVGIRAKIEQIEWGQWLSQVFCLAPCKNPDYDMSIIGHAEAWDIGNFANPKYYFRWDSAEFQKLFKESRGHGGRQEAARALREDAEDAGRRGARGVALHAPAAGRHQEGRHRHLEGPAGARPRPVRGRPGRSSRATPRRDVRRYVAAEGRRRSPPPSSSSRCSSSWWSACCPATPPSSSWALEASPEAVARLRRGARARPARRRSSTREWVGPGRSAATSAARSSTTCRWPASSSRASP